MSTQQPPTLRRLRRVGEACFWLLVIGFAIVAAAHVAARLRLVVLPPALALAFATVLAPVAGRLRTHGGGDAAAAVTVLAAATAVFGCLLALVVPPVVDQFAALDERDAPA